MTMPVRPEAAVNANAEVQRERASAAIAIAEAHVSQKHHTQDNKNEKIQRDELRVHPTDLQKNK
jgi:hypothetical protein